MFKSFSSKIFVLLALVVLAVPVMAQWTPVGPEGGDVRSLAGDPKNFDRILLGTSAGQLYQSLDRGSTWTRFADLGREDYVVDNISFDPQNSNLVYAAAWSVESISDGDVFRSKDGGRTWTRLDAMHGKSVRAMELAPSDPKIIVAGALDGVWRSKDGGSTWEHISPFGHPDIKNIESIAVDPRNPDVIYAGTWHLPWKTADGGKTWRNIKNGVIDDSDVFSIIIDHQNPDTVFASACSGIYRSETAGDAFKKIAGIPFSSRRTRVLMQDPANSSIVYAGTTEGLWKSTDNGRTYTRITPAKYIINDIYIDSHNPKHMLLATDRSGVLASDDGMATFHASNAGFSHRQVSSIVVDRKNAENVYVGLINDKDYGGVFVSKNGGNSWVQMSEGLGSRDVFDLHQASNGSLLAATNQGIFLMAANGQTWTPSNTVIREIARPAPKPTKVKGKTVTPKPLPPTIVKSQITGRVSSVNASGSTWWAATASGLYSSNDSGKAWKGGAVLGLNEFVGVDSEGEMVVAAAPKSVVLSTDGGVTWKSASSPYFLTRIYGVTIAPDSQIWISTREGAYRSADQGTTWVHAMEGLPGKNVLRITRDGDRLLATAYGARSVFETSDNGKSWHVAPDTGMTVRAAARVSGRLIAATTYNGLVLQRSAPQGQTKSAVVTAGSGGNQ